MVPFNKKLLTSGKLAETAGGNQFMVVFAKSLGYFLIDEEGDTLSLEQYENDLTHPDKTLTIDYIWTIPETENIEALNVWGHFEDPPTNTRPEPPVTSTVPDDNPNEDRDIPNKAQLSTSVWLEINGKPVDPNNMSADEANLLVGLGILPESFSQKESYGESSNDWE